MKKSVIFLVGLTFGALVGVASGLILAPEKGSKTRKKLGKKVSDIKETMEDVTKKLGKKIQDTKETLKSKWQKSKDELKDKIDELED
ncbi:MAG: YtxH domain-containing protein [Flavobacteriales bacterium Tduv]